MKRLLAVITICSCLALAAWANNKSSKQGAASPAQARPVDGEQVYKTNCTRCHFTPPSMNKRQIRAAVRHMRVRANLLAEQADAVSEYLTETARSK